MWSSPGVFVNPAGTNLLTYYGFALLASDNPALDLSCQKIISPKYFLTAQFVPERQVVFTGSGSALNVHDLRTLDFKNLRPTVQITAPASGTVFLAPAVVEVSASANDLDGTVSRVQFFLNSTLVGSATGVPYEVLLTGLRLGTNVISSVAIDNLGTPSTSVTNTVIAQLPPPLVLHNPRLFSDGFGFRVGGGGNRPCVVETSTNLQTWIPVATNLPPFDYTDSRSTSETARFYRVK